MTYKTAYLGVIDEIIAILKADPNLAAIDDNNILFGEREKVAKFPVIFVIPRPDEIDDMTVSQQEHRITVDVVVLQKKYDVEEGAREAIEFAGDCYDCIMGNRTLNGKCEDLIVKRFEPDYEKGAKWVLHWTLIRIEVLKIL